MKILAIDQSLTETGYWIDDNVNGIIKSKLKGQIERIANIRDVIIKLVSENKIDIVVMEGYSFGASNTKFTFTAGELGGMIKLYCYDKNIKLYIIPSLLLKKYVCGKGNVKKEQMLLQLYKKTGREFNNNNIADAYGMHLFFMCYQQWIFNNRSESVGKEIWTLNELDCFKRLDKLFNNPSEDLEQDV